MKAELKPCYQIVMGVVERKRNWLGGWNELVMKMNCRMDEGGNESKG